MQVNKQESVQTFGTTLSSGDSKVGKAKTAIEQEIKPRHQMQRWWLVKIYLCVVERYQTSEPTNYWETMEQWVNKDNILKSILVSRGMLRLGTPFK